MDNLQISSQWYLHGNKLQIARRPYNNVQNMHKSWNTFSVVGVNLGTIFKNIPVFDSIFCIIFSVLQLEMFKLKYQE